MTTDSVQLVTPDQQVNSKIFWRITLGIFLSILLIEFVLLVYSWYGERSRLLTRLDESLMTVESLIDTTDPIPQLEQLLSQNSRQKNKITGYIHISDDGIESRGGNTSNLKAQVSANKPVLFDSTSGKYVRYFPIDASGSQSLFLNIDASWINSYMEDYVWRILGMVVLISLFVTVACLFFLKPILINPLLRLDRLLVRGEQKGIEHAEANTKDLARTDELGSVFRSFNVLREQLLTAKQELVFQATHDVLTQLGNRRKLTTEVESCLELYESDGRTFSLMIMDLDRFKIVNDSAGHAAGDALLQILSEMFNSQVEDHETVARLGGDEFAILLPGKNLEQAHIIAENVRHEIEKFNFIWEENLYKVTVSIGIAEVSEQLATQESIIFAADTCCLESKRSGKNLIRRFDNENSNVSVIGSQSLWISRIINALETDGFSLFTQSIVPIEKDSDEEHFEVLVRMKNPAGGLWFPDKFLPIAEQNNLMPKIDEFIVNKALMWLTEQVSVNDKNYCMNINLSGSSLSDQRFRDFLIERVSTTQDINHFVCFEMTESAAMTNADQVVTLLEELKSMGCRIALDDFGTGFSSLSQIRELPLDYIKIDGSFVTHIVTNELDQAVVKSVSEIAKVLNISTVAEFVETEEMVRTLQGLKIDYAQGYLYSKPAPIEDRQQSDDSSRKAA